MKQTCANVFPIGWQSSFYCLKNATEINCLAIKLFIGVIVTDGVRPYDFPK